MNIYEELGIAITVTDPEQISKIAEEKRKEWNKLQGDFEKGKEAAEKVKLFKKIITDIKKDPSIIQRHQYEYRQKSEGQKREQIAQIKKGAAMIIRSGVIDPLQLESISAKYPLFTSEEILQILGVKLKYNYKDDGIKELDNAIFNAINEKLSLFDKDDLYGFLNLRNDASKDIVAKKNEEIYNKHYVENPNKDARSDAVKFLYDKCKEVLLNAEVRPLYDKSLSMVVLYEIEEQMAIFTSSTKQISHDIYLELLSQCVEGGVGKDKAAYYINKFAASQHASILEEIPNTQQSNNKETRKEKEPNHKKKQQTKNDASIKVIGVNFYNTDTNGNRLPQGSNYLYSNTQYLSAEIIASTNFKNADKKVDIRCFTPSGRVITSDAEVTVSAKTMSIAGYGNDGGTAYSEHGKYIYEVWSKDEELIAKETFIIKNRPTISISKMTFENVDTNGRSLPGHESYLHPDSQFIKAKIEITCDSEYKGEQFPFKMRIISPSGKTLIGSSSPDAAYTFVQNIVLGGTSYDIDSWGSTAGNLFTEEGVYKYQVWAFGQMVLGSSFKIRQPIKEPEGKLNKSIHKIFQKIDDGDDNYIGFILTTVAIIWVGLIIYTFSTDGFWSGIWAAIKYGFAGAIIYFILFYSRNVVKWIFYNAVTLFSLIGVIGGILALTILGSGVDTSTSKKVETVEAPLNIDVYHSVSRSGLNIRSKANASSSVVGTLQYGAEIDVYRIEGDFAVISYNSGTAYVSSEYIKKGEFTANKLSTTKSTTPTTVQTSPTTSSTASMPKKKTIAPKAEKKIPPKSVEPPKPQTAEGYYNEGVKLAKRFQEEQALPLLKKSSEMGYVNAMYYLGMMYINGGNIEENPKLGFDYVLKAAKARHKEATFQVGEMYNGGIGTRKDKTQAKVWYQKALDMGDNRATSRLRRL